MRNRFAQTFYEIAKTDSRQCMIVADISPAGSMAKFRDEFPQRFINSGVAEQVMIGLAPGMCQRGLRPFAYTIATFAFYRPFEMIRDDLCYQNLPVTVVGIGGGVSYSTLGATHHAQEDVAIAMAVPNLRVLAPCDPLEVEAVTRWCTKQEQGPVYLRLGKAGEPELTAGLREPWQFGKLRVLRQGSTHCLLTYGVITKMVLEVAAGLEHRGISTSVVTTPTLKPLDREGLAEVLRAHKTVSVIEECAPRALGLEVEALAKRIGYSGSVETIALQDEFIHCFGTHADILAAHGLSADALVALIVARANHTGSR
jgi:transketolase